MIGKIVHWLARITAALMVAFFLLFFIFDGGFCVLKLTVREVFLMLSMLTIIYGLAEGWNNEKNGGLLTVVGLLAFYVLNKVFIGSWPGGPWFAFMALPAVLYLISWRLNK